MHHVSINKAPNNRIGGNMSALLDNAEREMVMIIDDRQQKGDDNS